VAGSELVWRPVRAALGTRVVGLSACTAVLALGGPADFKPGESEWIDRARPHMKENPRPARELIAELPKHILAPQPPRSPRLCGSSR
jgi:hypothetical protein